MVVILGELGIKPAVGVNKGLPAVGRQIFEQTHEGNQEGVRNGMAPPMDAASVFTGHFAQAFVGQGLAKFSTKFPVQVLKQPRARERVSRAANEMRGGSAKTMLSFHGFVFAANSNLIA